MSDKQRQDHIMHKVTIFEASAGSTASQAVSDAIVEAFVTGRLVRVSHNGSQFEVNPHELTNAIFASGVKGKTSS